MPNIYATELRLRGELEPGAALPVDLHAQKIADMRSFSVEEYLEKKTVLICDYLESTGLDTIVFGMSGGVDSAVVGGLLAHIKDLPDSPLKRVVAVVAPIYTGEATNQTDAEVRALECCEALGIEVWYCPLTEPQRAYNNVMADTPSKATGDKLTWANGQILSITRTPIFYGVAAHLQAEGFRSVVAGTTNRSEGSYIGFYGKASDGMCDFQPISDIWKSEVYQLAYHFGVPDSIVNEKPRGDVWDNRVDEEMIGAPYWFLEFWLELKTHPGAWSYYVDLLRQPEGSPYYEAANWVANIESLHGVNSHKYLVGSPAVHFDVMERHVPGGWSGRNSYTHTIGA